MPTVVQTATRLAAIGLTIAGSAAAQAMFVGCLADLPGDEGYSLGQMTMAECDNVCGRVYPGTDVYLGPWEYYLDWNDGSDGYCECFESQPHWDQLVAGADSAGNCMTDPYTPSIYLRYANPSGIREFGACANGVLPTASNTVATPEACWATCLSNYVWGKLQPDGTWLCGCEDQIQWTQGVCGPDSFVVWSRIGSDLPEPSALSRRAARFRPPALSLPCPFGLSACLVGSGNDYECIDPKVELESCGGCVAGPLRPPKVPALLDNPKLHWIGYDAKDGGVDCTAIPGVNPRKVSCEQGACVVRGCRAGWVLSNGKCVAA